MGISMLIPTWKRPNSIIRFVNHAFNSSSGKHHVEILFGCHEEDIESKDVISSLTNTEYFQTRCVIIPHHEDGKPHLVQFWNDLYPHSANDILGFFGDDVLIKTKNWDEIVIQEFDKDPIQLVYGDDVHIQRGDNATLFFTHKISHNAFGFYLYPPFRRWYMDTFMDCVFREANKINYKPELIFEHLHPHKFKETEDEVYLRMQPLIQLDQIVWESEKCKLEMDRCVAILKTLQQDNLL